MKIITIITNTSVLLKNLRKPNTTSRYWPVLHHFDFRTLRTMSTENLLDKKDGLTIATHDGVFHCDEVLGCCMLKVLFPKATIVRSRDPQVLNNCDIVIDVGGVYDPQRHRYDHHQKSFELTMSSLDKEFTNDIRLSSAGLIYHHFGKKILKKILNTDNEAMADYIYKRIYNNFIQEIDGIDNGIPAFSQEPRYNICTHLSARIQHMNKPWYVDEGWNDDEHFQKAMDVVYSEFLDNVDSYKKKVYPAREVVFNAIQNRYDIHPSGEIIELSQHCPWKDHFFDLENLHNINPKIKYVLFKGEDSYRVMAVSVTNKSFVCRKFLPSSWRGLRDEILSEKAGIDGCIFVHSNGFIGGNKTREGAFQMAVKSLEYETGDRRVDENIQSDIT